MLVFSGSLKEKKPVFVFLLLSNVEEGQIWPEQYVPVKERCPAKEMKNQMFLVLSSHFLVHVKCGV